MAMAEAINNVSAICIDVSVMSVNETIPNAVRSWAANTQGASSVPASDTRNHTGTNQPNDRPRTTAVSDPAAKMTASTRKNTSNIDFNLRAVAHLARDS